MIFYTDGTFSEIKNVTKVQEFGDKPLMPGYWLAPCSVCGKVGGGSCAHTKCPTGLGSPWDNSTKVVD